MRRTLKGGVIDEFGNRVDLIVAEQAAQQQLNVTSPNTKSVGNTSYGPTRNSLSVTNGYHRPR